MIFSAGFVNAQPAVTATPGQLEFGPTPVYQLKYLRVELTNQTDAMVYFLQQVASSPVFYAYPQNWAMQAGETVEMYVSFQPDSAGMFDAVLSMSIYTAFGVDTLLILLAGEGSINGVNRDLFNPVIYPNPSNGRFNIAGLSNDSQIRLYDMNGRVVWSGTG